MRIYIVATILVVANLFIGCNDAERYKLKANLYDSENFCIKKEETVIAILKGGMISCNTIVNNVIYSNTVTGETIIDSPGFNNCNYKDLLFPDTTFYDWEEDKQALEDMYFYYEQTDWSGKVPAFCEELNISSN